MTTEPIGVAIAGLGRSGYDIHARTLRQAPERFRIVAVADGMAERRAEAVEAFGCRAYDDHHELIGHDGVDLFINALPSPLHPSITIEALDAGMNVVCEKPVAITTADMDRMIAAAQRAGRVLAPFQNYRFFPFFRKIQEIVASGVLGEILHVRIAHEEFLRRWDWQTRRVLWGGSLNNTAPHRLDHAVMLFGEQTPRVFSRLASGPGSAGDADDLATVTLYGPGRPTIEVLISSYSVYPTETPYVISGSHGGLVGGSKQLRWRYYNGDACENRRLMTGWSDRRTYCREELNWIESTWTAPAVDDTFVANAAAFYDNIHDVLTGAGELVVTCEQVRRQVAVIEQCHRQNPPHASAE